MKRIPGNLLTKRRTCITFSKCSVSHSYFLLLSLLSSLPLSLFFFCSSPLLLSFACTKPKQDGRQTQVFTGIVILLLTYLYKRTWHVTGGRRIAAVDLSRVTHTNTNSAESTLFLLCCSYARRMSFSNRGPQHATRLVGVPSWLAKIFPNMLLVSTIKLLDSQGV